MNNLEFARYIDHTNLKQEITILDIHLLCNEAVRYNFASVCVRPAWVKEAYNYLREILQSNILITTVIDFPDGNLSYNDKVDSASRALNDGANELDVVINWRQIPKFINSHYRSDFAFVVGLPSIVEQANRYDAIVKVIIESSELNFEQQYQAFCAARDAGALFIKTSTGYASGGAKKSDVRFLHQLCKPAGMFVKASGGIKTLKQALDFIKIGASRIGTSSAIKMMKEMDNGF
jgi:deoxyribose-phosphate aldolase